MVMLSDFVLDNEWTINGVEKYPVLTTYYQKSQNPKFQIRRIADNYKRCRMLLWHYAPVHLQVTQSYSFFNSCTISHLSVSFFDPVRNTCNE